MALTNAYSVAPPRLPDVFEKIRDGQAPPQFSQQLLKDWGFASSNDRAVIPILKTLGFLSPDGRPTQIYHDYRDHSRSKSVMAQALRQAYADIFLIKEHPTEQDKDAIQGKFKSYHNVNDNLSSLMTKTFLTLLSLADLKASPSIKDKTEQPKREEEEHSKEDAGDHGNLRKHAPSLHYNVQIHLPATKEVEVYNAIFKSLKEHIFEE